MTQIEAIYFQTSAPIFKIRFACIAHRCVPRKPRSDDKLGAGAQKFDARLVTNLQTAAGQQRDTPTQIRELGSLAEVQVAALGAKLIVEMVSGGIMLLADVAMLCLEKLASFGISIGIMLMKISGRKHIWRGENRSTPQNANAGFRPDALVPLQLRGLMLALHGLEKATPGRSIWTRHLAGGEQQTRAFLGRYRGEESSVAYNRLKKFGGGVDTGCKRAVCRIFNFCGRH